MHAGWSPLHWAIYHDNVTVVRALLSAGAAAPYKKAQVRTTICESLCSATALIAVICSKSHSSSDVSSEFLKLLEQVTLHSMQIQPGAHQYIVHALCSILFQDCVERDPTIIQATSEL